MHVWKPYIPQGLLNVTETSCYEEYRLCHEAATYFVLRPSPGTRGSFEETGRGEYGHALGVWMELSASHDHKPKASARPEPEPQEGAAS